jgi:hypothetical protein
MYCMFIRHADTYNIKTLKLPNNLHTPDHVSQRTVYFIYCGNGGASSTVSDVDHYVITVNLLYSKLKKLNSVAVVRKRTISTERPPLVGEVSANLCG